MPINEQKVAELKKAPSDGSMDPWTMAKRAGAGVLRLAAPIVGGAGGAMLGSLLGIGTEGAGLMSIPTFTAAGAGAGSALAETIAEKYLEDRPVNTKEVLLQGGLGAVPGSWMVKEGKPLASAAYGAAAGAIGTAGLKAAQGTPLKEAVNPLEWNKSDFIGPAAGAITGGAYGALTRGRAGAEMATPAAPQKPALKDIMDKVNSTEFKNHETGLTPLEHQVLIRSSSKYRPTTPPRTPDEAIDIARQVETAHDQARAMDTKSAAADTQIQEGARADQIKDLNEEGKAIAADEKAKAGIQKAFEKDSAQEAKNLNARDKFLDKTAGQEAKNLNAQEKFRKGLVVASENAEKENQARTLAAKKAARIASLKQGKNYVEPSAVGESISTVNPVTGATESARGRWETPPKQEGEVGPAAAGFNRDVQDILDQVSQARQKPGDLLASVPKSLRGGVPIQNSELAELGLPPGPKPPPAPKMPKLGKTAPAPLSDSVKAELQRMHDELDMHDASQQHIIQNDKGENVKALNVSAPKVYTDITQNGGLNTSVGKVKQTIADMLAGKAPRSRAVQSAIEVAEARANGQYNTGNGTKVTSLKNGNGAAKAVEPLEAASVPPPAVEPLQNAAPTNPLDSAIQKISDKIPVDETGQKVYNPEGSKAPIEELTNGVEPKLADMAAQLNQKAPQVAKVNFPAGKIQGSSLPTGEQQGAMFGVAPKTEPENLFEQAAKPAEASVTTQMPKSSADLIAKREAQLAEKGKKFFYNTPEPSAPGAEPTPEAPATGVPKKPGLPVLAKEDDLIKNARQAANEYRPVQEASKAAGGKQGDPALYAKARELGAKAAEGSSAIKLQNAEDLKLLEGLDPESRKAAIRNIIKDFASDESGMMDPKLAIRLGMMVAGGAAGAAFDPLGNRTASALAGAGAGAVFSPSAIRALMRSPAAETSMGPIAEKAKETLTTFIKLLPDAQRFNLLMSHNLPINTFVGPWGSSVMAGLEKALSGDPAGVEILKRFLNPKNFPREWWTATGEASELIEHAAGRAEMSGAGPEAAQKVFSFPGKLMTAGDVAARNLLMDAGLSPEEARAITLTSEPYSQAAEGIMDLRRKDSIPLQMAIPFARTNLNQLEQSLERTPFWGFVQEQIKANKGGVAATFPEAIVKQGMGAMVWYAGYELGKHTPANVPGESRQTASLARKLANDFGGQYGALASTGFMAGQIAQNSGQDLFSNMWKGAVRSMSSGDLPLPTAQPAVETGNMIYNIMEGNTDKLKLPSGAYPLIAKDVYNAVQPAPKGIDISKFGGRVNLQNARPSTAKGIDFTKFANFKK